MKYTLDLLPLRAFQGRGTPVGGRGLRLCGGGDGGGWELYTNDQGEAAMRPADMAQAPSWTPQGTPEGSGWTAPVEWSAPAAEPAPAPAPEPAWSPPPEAYNPPPEAYNPPPEPAWSPPPAPAPANQWQQTVNDIYQQTFGRQADPSGMASFTAALNAGMTGEQMRAILASSAEGQSMGLAPAAPTGIAALPAAAKPAQWEYQPGGYYNDETTGLNGYTAPYYLDINSGERKTLETVEGPRYTPIDPNTLAQHVGPNFEGTPTQFYDDKGNLKGVLVDAVRAGLGTREGELILDPMSLGLALKPGETASLNSALQQRNEQNQLLFIDPNTGGTTIYNTGVPAETGSTVKDLLYINERKYGGQIPADMAQGALLLAATMATGGVGGALMNAAGFGAGAGAGLGAGAVAGGDIGAFLAADAAASAGSAGINWGAAATAAAKTAAINAAVTAAQGGNIGQVLKAGALGAVTGGAGVAGADFLGGGALAQIGTQTAIATAVAAATGRDPVQAAISGALTATLSNVIPAGTADVLNGAGITDPSIQKAINSAISSSVVTAIRGGDVGTAAIMGAVNSGLASVAGMIGNSQVVQDIKANITNALTSTIDSVKYEIGATNAQALPIEGSNRSPVGTELDTAPYDANAELDRVIQNLPSSASGVEYTPAAPPLVQAAINQNTSNPDDLNQFFANYTPNVGAPLGTYAGATTSDVDPVALAPNRFSSSGPVSVSWNEPEATAGDTTAGGFLGEYGDLAPAQSRLATFGQGVASALDNTVGAILPTVAQMASYLGLRTGDQIAELTASLIGKDYQANPELMREISNRVAEAISNPFGKAFGVTNTPGYAGEASGQVLRFISENLDKGADYLSEKTGLPAGDIRLMTDAILMRPGTALSTVREAGAAVKDVGRGYADAATGIVNESPTGAYNLGASVADLTRAPDTSLMRGESPTRNINLGEIIDEAPSYVSPERLSAPTPALGYSPTEVAAAPRDVASIFNDAFEAADRIPTYDVRPQPTATPATQLAPESRGALPTTLAEPAIKPIDLGPYVNPTTAANIVAEGRTLDQAVSRGLTPELQNQAKSYIDNTYTQVADKPPSSISSAFFDDIFFSGAGSEQTTKAISDVVNNPAAPPEVILKQVDKAIEPLNADEQLPAKLAMLSNASKLGITPAEAIKLGLLNNNGTKTELGEKVLPEPQPQPRPQPQPQPRPQPKPYPDPVAPLTPVKPTLPVKPPLPPIPTPPGVNPPPPGVNPVNPVVNPPVNPVNPPAVDVNPPIPTPPPLVQAAITPPAATPKASAPATTMTPSYMYGTGTQGTTIGALPGNLQSTFLQGVNVNEYNPFENYNVYQQLGSPAPVRAAEGGSPLQLAQMQQGIYGVNPSLYGVLQKRAAPNYFTYGSDTSGGNPTTFAGSQLMGKPTPGIPVIPTGQKAAADWLYQGSGTNPLAMAGTGIATLPTGTMAEGGQAHGGEGEHIPEFITGATGHYVRGRGDGQSDDIPAMLADGEYVFDASTVSTLGNGSSDAGAKLLDAFRESLRDHTRSAPADKIPPKASPLEYMKEALRNVGRK
jgi:hypothetical protein